jgi:4-hydroxy-3-polyprenylbenzoate decarboxylase
MANRPIFHSLQQFLLFLDRRGELRRITVPVDPYLEASAIAIRAMKEDGKAILFENIIGSKFPLAMNILSSDRRIEYAVGEEPQYLGKKLVSFVEDLLPPKPGKLFGSAKPFVGRMFASRTKHSASPPSQLNELAGKLGALPILQTWPDDSGKFITLPHVLTYDLRSGKRNVGMYRMQVYDNDSSGMHWQIQKGGGFHYVEAESKGKPLEVGVAVGVDPALLLATIAPLPEGIDEILFAGFLRGEATRMASGKRISIAVPAEAEFVLEGIVAPQERKLEGPFGDHFGHYSHAGMFPVFRIKTITHRDNPIFAATIVGKPPMEDKWLGNATQQILGPLAKLTHPEVRDLWAFYEAGFHNLLGVSTSQRYGKEAMKTGLSLVSDNQLSLTKCAVIAGEHANSRNFRALLREIGAHFDPRYDLMILNKIPMDTLDFTSYTMNLGSKILFDATPKLGAISSGGNYPPRKPSRYLEMVGSRPERDLSAFDMRIRDWQVLENTLLVVRVDGPYKSEPNAAKSMENEVPLRKKTPGREIVEKLISEENLARLPKGTKIVAAVSADVNLSSDIEVIWGIFTRFDAARDVMLTSASLEGVTALYEGVIGIDATWKPGYPNPCEIPDEITSKVEKRWKEYGF